MKINLDKFKRSLPYELCARITMIPINNATNATLTTQLVELFVNETVLDSGILSLPYFLKDFVIPLTHLNVSQRYEIVVTRGNTSSFMSTTATKSKKSWTLRNILKEISNNQHSQYNSIVFQEKNYQIMIEWKLIENTLFRVKNIQPALHIPNNIPSSMDEDFQQQHMPTPFEPSSYATSILPPPAPRMTDDPEEMKMSLPLSETKLSQQLKEKIIILSLSLQSSECQSLLQEISNLMILHEDFITDMDIIAILEDINLLILQRQSNGTIGGMDSLQSLGNSLLGLGGGSINNSFGGGGFGQSLGGNGIDKFSKVISFLKEADEESFTQKRNSLSYILLYPAVMPIFSCYVPITTMQITSANTHEVTEARIGLANWDISNSFRAKQLADIIANDEMMNDFLIHQPLAMQSTLNKYAYNWQVEHNNYINIRNKVLLSSSSSSADPTNNTAKAAKKTGGVYKKNMYYIKLMLIGEEEISLDFYWKNMVDYIMMLKILSIMKALMIDDAMHPDGNSSNPIARWKEHVSVNGILIIEDRVYNNGIITLNPEERCLELSYESTGKEEHYRHGHLPILPWQLNFQYVSKTVYCTYDIFVCLSSFFFFLCCCCFFFFRLKV